MSGQSHGAEPDLTPILDMVFQLITFFMLVINFKGAALDQTLKLPVLGSARPLEYQGKYEPMVLNIDTQGRVTYFGQVHQIEDLAAREARLLKEQLKASGETNVEDLPTPIIIRGDKGVTFGLLNHIIRTCQQYGYRQFAFSAMNKADN